MEETSLCWTRRLGSPPGLGSGRGEPALRCANPRSPMIFSKKVRQRTLLWVHLVNPRAGAHFKGNQASALTSWAAARARGGVSLQPTEMSEQSCLLATRVHR